MARLESDGRRRGGAAAKRDAAAEGGSAGTDDLSFGEFAEAEQRAWFREIEHAVTQRRELGSAVQKCHGLLLEVRRAKDALLSSPSVAALADGVGQAASPASTAEVPSRAGVSPGIPSPGIVPPPPDAPVSERAAAPSPSPAPSPALPSPPLSAPPALTATLAR